MSNGYNGSRSPVRAISTAIHPAWGHTLPRPRTWGEAPLRTAAPPETTSTAFEAPLLSCPDCGSVLRLTLVRDAVEHAAPPQPSAPPAEAGPAPDFEEAVVSYKRELISRALAEHDGVMTRAAKALGLKYTTFVAMVHRLDIAASEG